MQPIYCFLTISVFLFLHFAIVRFLYFINHEILRNFVQNIFIV